MAGSCGVYGHVSVSRHVHLGIQPISCVATVLHVDAYNYSFCDMAQINANI